MAASLCRSLFHLPSPSPSPSPPLRTQQTPFPFLSNPNPNSMLSITTPKLPALLYAVGGGGGGGNTKEGKMTLEGVVTEALPNCMFRVKLDGGDTILGYIGGKVKKNKIWVMPGNRVRLEISKYDSSKGRIVYKLR